MNIPPQEKLALYARLKVVNSKIAFSYEYNVVIAQGTILEDTELVPNVRLQVYQFKAPLNVIRFQILNNNIDDEYQGGMNWTHLDNCVSDNVGSLVTVPPQTSCIYAQVNPINPTKPMSYKYSTNVRTCNYCYHYIITIIQNKRPLCQGNR